MSIVAIDFETSGLDPAKRAVPLSVGMARLDDTLTVVDKFEVFILPEPDAVIEEEAMRVNGYSEQKWRELNAVPLSDAVERMKAWLPGKPEMLAHNAGFDKQFMAITEARTNQKLYLSYAWHCSMALFKAVNLAHNLGYTKSSLSFSARTVGHWGPDYNRGFHGALEDALACAAVFKWCVGKMRDGLPGQREFAL